MKIIVHNVHSNASNEMCPSFLVSLLDKINLCSVQSAERHIIASQARIVPNICIIQTKALLPFWSLGASSLNFSRSQKLTPYLLRIQLVTYLARYFSQNLKHRSHRGIASKMLFTKLPVKIFCWVSCYVVLASQLRQHRLEWW